MGSLTIPKDQAIAIALQRHQAGESLRQIAPDLNISHVRLRAILLGDVPEEYKAAQADALLERIAEADELLEDSIVTGDDGKIDAQSSNVNIARAREIGKFARFDAERRLPHLFGARHEVKHTHQGLDMDSALQGARKALQGRTIDVTPTTSSDDDSQDRAE